ncbi:MAG: TIGR02266 family protein [Oligoflexales bacterium]|nr:TIGR02266 family protein [Oligoflexales bacterium]
MVQKKEGKKKKKNTPKRPDIKEKPMAKEKKDARIDQRIPIQLLVDYRCDGHYLFDFCKDLGTGGVFIETANPLSHGSRVDLTFTLPDSKETLETQGRVIWVQSAIPEKNLTPGMGVQFESFSPSQRKTLEDFLARYHGDKTVKQPSKPTPLKEDKTA